MNKWEFYANKQSKLTKGERARMNKACKVCGEPIPLLLGGVFCIKHKPKHENIGWR